MISNRSIPIAYRCLTRTSTAYRFMSSNLRQRSVVSSFICTPPQSPSGLTFALFKRSGDISTYPGKWAVCSGSIDPGDVNAEAAAKREILEETTLGDEDIRLLRRGKPFKLIDHGLKTEWTIHPFAWQLKQKAKAITLDWEHTEVKFIKPEDLAEYDHVPQLEIGLRRVMVSSEMEEALKVLAEDHVSGAQALAISSLNLLLKSAREGELSRHDSAAEFWKELRWCAWHLAKNGRPSMSAAIEASIFKSLHAAREELGMAHAGGLNSLDVTSVKKAVEAAILRRVSAMEHRLDDLASHFVKFVENDTHITTIQSTLKDASSSMNIVSLSASNTIAKSISALLRSLSNKNQKIKLTVLESRPSFEGVSFARNLLVANQDPAISADLEVIIVSDASMALAVKDAHFLILGADKVLPNGDICNKIGSLPAAIVAKTLNPACRIIALHETEKITSSQAELDPSNGESNSEEELMESWSITEDIKAGREVGWNVRVKNEYFEWVPEKFIDVHISEEGGLSVHDIERLSHRAQEIEETLFVDV